MDEPQIIRTPDGEELVVLPRKEYTALVEALAEAEEELVEIAVLDQRVTELAEGQAERLPEEISAMILDGQLRVRAVRKWRSIGVAELAAKSGIPEAVINGAEVGAQAMARGDAEKVAAALDVPVAWIE